MCLIWWALSAAVQSPALPTPAQTLPVFAAEAQVIWPHFLVSLKTLALGMFFGTLFGAPAGLAAGFSRRTNKILSPILYILYPLPKVVLLPVLFVLLGIGGVTNVVLIAIAVFFQMMVTMRDAALEIPQTYAESFYSLGGTKAQCFVHIMLPLSLPSLFTALRIATGIAVAILFVSEGMAGSTGLGYFIMHSWSVLEYKKMFAGIVAMAVMGIVIYEAFEAAEKALVKHR